ncbi:hypothetical protein ACIQ7D_35620 [Streptomyces sp. NPDC096310]|uniref:hypothetical protein n=1 Tax=Streptomyces sp. NPDC096310 TaxID=3366082 RepID=UPI0037F71366
MSETTTRIDEAHGPTHTGPGTQNNYYAGKLSEDSKGRSPRAIAEAELLWLRRHFVEPEGYAEALETLEEQRLVLLDGAVGNGRSATARVLLHRLAPGRRMMRELLLEKDDEDSSRGLDPELIEDEGRLLLDLSAANDRRWETVQAELSAFRAVLPDRRAALVVVLPQGVRRLVPSAMTELHHVISRPPGQELDIIKLHLRRAKLDPGLADSGSHALAEFLERRPPLADVAGFAQYLCRAAAEDPSLSFATWCARALNALSGQPEDARKRLRDTPKGASRALLVATAMLHEARSDAVHRAASLLLTTVDPSVRARPALRHRPLSERLGNIEARTHADSRVRFSQFDLDAAIRTQVWHDFPDLRDALREWVGRILVLPELDAPDQEALVSRFASECLACRRPDDLLTLSERWTRTPDEARLLAAARALRHGLHHREFGPRFRDRIYTWATSRQLSAAQRRVLVDVCQADMAVRHPHAALVRLHHLARREQPGTLARDALTELMADNHRLRRRMLARLTSDNPSYLAADTGLFLSFAEPGPLSDPGVRSRPLITESAVRRDLTTGWARVFRTLPEERWTGHVHAWLDTVCEPSPEGDLFLDVLVAACGRRGDRLGLLYRTGRRWAAGQSTGNGQATALPGRLLQKVTEAQRARSTSAHQASARETTETTTP